MRRKRDGFPPGRNRPGARRVTGVIPSIALVLVGFVLVTAGRALAHGTHELTENPWTAWDFDLWIVVPLVLAAWVYVRGIAVGDGTAWRHVAFFAGLFAFYLVLQSPIEPISDHVFIVHQIEHMGLRTIGPMLVMLAAPQAAMMRGLPRWARGGLVAPIAGNRFMHGLFGVLAHPVGATVFFVAASYFWMIPAYHDRAILDEPIHYTWHVTLMLSGLIFFWRVLDARPKPLGVSLPARLVMLWFAAMGNILLGAYLSFKTEVLYHAYDVTGRMWDIGAATDERFGGLTMWIPGSMMVAMCALAIMQRWKHEEERVEARRQRQAEIPAIRADSFVASRRNVNRALALGIGGFVALVFILSILISVFYDRGLSHP